MAGSQNGNDIVTNGNNSHNNNNLRNEDRTESDTIYHRFRQDLNIDSDPQAILNKEAKCLNCKETFLIKEQNDVDVHYLNNLHDFSTVNCFYCNLNVLQYKINNIIYNYHSCTKARSLNQK